MFVLPDKTPTLPTGERNIDALEDTDLDALPFGAVCLDSDGTILRYNLYESRLARLDRNQVLGRNFFTEVAPCTRGEEFEGRFRTVVASGSAAPRQRFSFLFDFKFGAQQVDVEIVAVDGAPRYYVLINRRELQPARANLPADGYAVLQRELAPTEASQGVRRDDLEQRFVEVPWSVLAALRATCDRLAPESWPLFSSEWGTQWGRRLALDLESRALEGPGTTLRELTMLDAVRLIVDRLAAQGWGRTSFDFGAVREGMVRIDVERSALAESAPRSRASRVGAGSDLACHLLAGCFGALLSHLGNRRLTCHEVACRAGGAERCSFVVVAAPRRAVVEAVLAEGARGVEAVRGALRRAPASTEGR